MQNKRKRVWIDRFQTVLFFRLATYIIIYTAVITTFVAFWNWFAEFGTGTMRPLDWQDFSPALFGSLLLLPPLLWDALKFSHRLVGPLVRFRHAMKEIKAGVNIEPIKLRDGDFLQELKDDFNEMLSALKESSYFDDEIGKVESESKEAMHV